MVAYGACPAAAAVISLGRWPSWLAMARFLEIEKQYQPAVLMATAGCF